MSDRTQRFSLRWAGSSQSVARPRSWRSMLFNLLVHGFNTGHHALLADQPILAFVLANTVGMGVSYYGSRHWAFRDRPPRDL